MSGIASDARTIPGSVATFATCRTARSSTALRISSSEPNTTPGTRIPSTVPMGTSHANGPTCRVSIGPSHVQEDAGLDAATGPRLDGELVVRRRLHTDAGRVRRRGRGLELADEIALGQADHVEGDEPDALRLVDPQQLVQQRDQHA